MQEIRDDQEKRLEQPRQLVPVDHAAHLWKTVGIIFFCFVAGFLGAWAAIESGVIKGKSSQAITENRQTVVLQEGEVIAAASKKVSPSVVSITSEGAIQSAFGRETTQTGAGTGIIVSNDGYIITNKHVVPEGVSNVTVVTTDNKTYENVPVIGRDPVNDLAFLKIPNVNNLQAAELGDSDKVQVGQKVIAIGNALGQFQNTVTEGIISGLGRPVEAGGDGQGTEQLSNLFQTDAAINPGNSGGPLVDIDGKIIGITVAIAQDAQGIGFAIPINDAKSLIESVISKGEIVRPYLGVQYVMLTAANAKALNAPIEHGALIYASNGEPVVANSPAQRAGLQRGDIITKVNGQDVSEQMPLASRLTRFKPGDEVELTVRRNNQDTIIKATLDQYR